MGGRGEEEERGTMGKRVRVKCSYWMRKEVRGKRIREKKGKGKVK